MGLYDEMQNRRNGVTSGIGSFNSKYGLSSPAGQTALRQATEAGVPRGLSYGAFDSRGNRLKVPKTSDYMRSRSTPGGIDAAPQNSARLSNAPVVAAKPVVQDDPAETEIDYDTAPALDPRAQAQKNKDKEEAIRRIVTRMQNYNLDRVGARQYYEEQGFADIFDELITDDLDLSNYGYGVGG